MNMRYDVKLTTFAIGQISETIAYISKVLLVPETAKAWSDHLEKEIRSLDSMPARYPLIDREPWRSKGIRKMPKSSYMIDQLARAGTSVGANIHEAQYAHSKPDFIAKLFILKNKLRHLFKRK